VELSSQSKILPHGKVKLVDEYLLEGIQTVLLVEDKHCLLVVDGVNRTIRRMLAKGVFVFYAQSSISKMC
jgi:hypothetical protein